MAKRKGAKHHVQLQTLRVSWTDSRRHKRDSPVRYDEGSQDKPLRSSHQS